MYPQTDWSAAFATTAAFGVTLASPRGMVEQRGRRLAIGVISVCNGRVYVTPREGLDTIQTAALLAKAWCAWRNGPVGPRWTPDLIAGMVTTVYVRDQLSMTVSRAMAMSSAVGSPRNPTSDWLWG